MTFATRVLSALMILLGAAMLVSALAAGGGPLATGVIFGILFMIAGGLRLWAERKQ